MIGSFRKKGCTCKKKRCTCGAKWHYRFDTKDPVTGQRKQKETRGFETKAEAEAEAKRILAELSKGTYIEEKNITFKEFADQWIEMYASSRKVKESTIDIRRAKLRNLLEYFSQIKMKDITKKMYQDTLFKMKSTYSKKTIMLIHETANMLFAKAVDLEVISTNIAKNAEMPFVQQTVSELEQMFEEQVPKYLEKEELARFLDTASRKTEIQYYALFFTMAYTGMRPGEVCALKWKDIDFEDNTISITKTIYNIRAHPTNYRIHTPKTRKSFRKIDVEPEVLKIISEHKAKQNVLKMKYRDTYHDDGFVFTNERSFPGHAILPGHLVKRFKTILRNAGITKKLTPHSLRHTHTSLMAEAGVSLEQIMDRLGHQDDAITKRVYLHVTKARKKEASQKFAELMRTVR